MITDENAKRVTQRELAAALNLSQPMICRLQRQGMPGDVEGAKAWRAAHLDPARIKTFRMPAIDLYRAALDAIERLGLAVAESGDAAALAELRSAFLALPEGVRDRIRLPMATWNLLCGLGEPPSGRN